MLLQWTRLKGRVIPISQAITPSNHLVGHEDACSDYKYRPCNYLSATVEEGSIANRCSVGNARTIY